MISYTPTAAASLANNPPQGGTPSTSTIARSGFTPFTSGQTPAVPAAVTPAPNTNANAATFKATGTESPLGIVGKVLGNMPSSALNFAKNAISFFNPLNTAKTAQDIGTTAGEALNEGDTPGQLVKDTVAGLPAAAYQVLVPQFIKHIVNGDYQSAAATLENDPVGQIAPLLLVGKQVADAAGKGAAFDAAMSKIATPVTAPVAAAAAPVANAAGSVAAQLLGASTGSGASSVKEAFAGSPAFTAAMRGKINPDQIVQSAQDAVSNIADARRSAYLSKLGDIGKNTTSLDISPIQQTLYSQLSNFGIKPNEDGSLDFSRSSIANNGSARADVQGVYDTLKSWGSQAGDRTPIGLDTLKKQLSDFYSQSGSARALVQAVKSKVDTTLKTQVPGYSNLTSGYSQATQLLNDIKSATGAGSNAKVDTVFTKLTTAMKADKSLRLEVLNEMQSQGAQPGLMSQIAGMNMQSAIPKGLVGKGADIGAAFAFLGHYFQPQFIPLLLSTSPRVVGEFARTLGIASNHVQAITGIINKYGGKLPTSAAGATTRQNLPPAQTQPSPQ